MGFEVLLLAQIRKIVFFMVDHRFVEGAEVRSNVGTVRDLVPQALPTTGLVRWAIKVVG